MVVRRRSVLGRRIWDPRGRLVGTVTDTWPYDGGGEIEMVVLRLPRLGERRMLPIEGLRLDILGQLRTSFAAWQVEDSPALGEGRHAADGDERARSFWRWEEPATDSLPRRWQRSSGSSAMGKRFPTTPSPTPNGS
jgi:hypothetical protein